MKNFSCCVKRLSNKNGKNSRNNKFFKILLLQREKAKKGFVKSANFALKDALIYLRTAYFIFSYTHYIQLMFTANEFFILKTMTLFSGAQGYILS